MELYRKVRLACAEGMSARAAARYFGISRDSVKKMLAFSVRLATGARRQSSDRSWMGSASNGSLRTRSSTRCP